MSRRKSALSAWIASVIVLAGVPAHAAKLWIAWDTGVRGCRGTVEDMFACVLGATQYTTMAAAYPSGRALTFGGTTVLPRACSALESTSASTAQDVSTFQCVEDQAGFDLQNGDVLLYYVNHSGCTDGRNHWGIPLVANGHSARVNIGLSYSGTSCTCQTVFGFHEVYEASAQESAADCCNGQAWTGCPATPSPWGWYNLSGCASGTFNVQEISPARAEFNAAYCTRLTVDRTALCAQTRAVRTAGRCVGDSLETCALALTTTDCHGMGCSDTPTPHCNTFAASCHVSAPAEMCSGGRGTMTVTCSNDGENPWDASLAIGAASSDAASLFADTTWLSPMIAATVEPSTVTPGTTGTFTFALHAPEVLAPITYSLQFSLQELGGTVYATPSPDTLSATITVAPCEPDAGNAMDAGRDVASADGSSPDGGENGGITSVPGCGCRAAGRGAVHFGAWMLVGLVVVGAAIRRRGRR